MPDSEEVQDICFIYIWVVEARGVNEDYATGRVVGVSNSEILNLGCASIQVMANGHYNSPNSSVNELSRELSQRSRRGIKVLTVLFPAPIGPITL